MALRQSTTTPASPDVLAMPLHIQARAHQLAAARAARMEELRVAAEGRHARRCKESRAHFMNGAQQLAVYRAAIAESEAQRDDDVADAPPPVNLDVMYARVEVRALGAVGGWWTEELDRAAQAQREWTPAGDDGDDGQEGNCV